MRLEQNLARVGHASYDELSRLLREKVDPWHFHSSPYEQGRFRKMLSLLEEVPHARVLEVGCAEGHFTERLLTTGASVTAIDLSGDAIERARRRAPGASFLVTKLEEMPDPSEPYDVAICGEMLYYVEDISHVLSRLRRCARYLLTSTCYPSAVAIHRGLSSCRLLRTCFHASLREFRATSIRLWEL